MEESLPALITNREEGGNTQYITFEIGDECFGINLHTVEEIVLPQKVTKVPQTPKYFLGILNLRGEIVSIVDLRMRFGLEKKAATEYSRVIIVHCRGIKLGLLVDKIRNIASFSNSAIKVSLPMMGKDQQNYIYGSVKMADNKVILLLLADNLIAEEDFKIHQKAAPKYQSLVVSSDTEVEEVKVREIHMVAFSIENENYSLPGAIVEEIIEFPQITPLPEKKSFIKGIFYLRSSAIPVIDLAERLGFKEINHENQPPVIIVTIKKFRIGLIIEKIFEVFHVKETEILPTPANISPSQAEQLKGIIKVKRNGETRMIMYLNLENTLSEDETNMLEQLSEEIRAEAERTEQVEDTAEDIMLFFELNSELFAIPVLETNEIISPPPVVPVPKASSHIKGVINVRGTVMPVINLPKIIHNREIVFDDLTKFVIIQLGEDIAAIIVQKLLGIKKVKHSEYQTSSDLISQKGNLIIKDIIQKENKIIMVVNLEKTMNQIKGNEIPELALEEVKEKVQEIPASEPTESQVTQ